MPPAGRAAPAAGLPAVAGNAPLSGPPCPLRARSACRRGGRRSRAYNRRMLGEISGLILIAACAAVGLVLAAGSWRLWRAAAPRAAASRPAVPPPAPPAD